MGKKLNHIIDNGTFYLYYDNTLLLKNGKSMPFIVLKKFVNGVESDLGLSEYTFEEQKDRYELVFSNEEINVKVTITESEKGKLKFSFEDIFIGEYEEICITLWKENEDRVYGLPMFQPKRKKRRFKRLFNLLSSCKCTCISKHFKREKPFMPEQKLSFYLSGKYFFENINLVSDYVLAVADKIYLTVKKGKFDFRLRFYENMEEMYSSSDINNYHVKKYPIGSIFLRMSKVNEPILDAYLNGDSDNRIKGVILEYEDFDLARIMTEKKKIKDRNLDAIFVLTKNISEKHAEMYFKGENYSRTVYGERNADLWNNEGLKKYMVTVRKVLDTGADGIYFDDDFSKRELTALHQQVKIMVQEYPNLTEKEMSDIPFMKEELFDREFPQVALFHTHLSEDNDDFGYYIVKEEKAIEKMKELRPYFFYSGECYIGKEEKVYMENNEFDINIIKID